VRVLIENKVDAGFQRDQAARYRERAKIYAAEADCLEATTLLIAPAVYLGDAGNALGFDAVLTYEEIRSWFTASPSDARATYKAAVLTAAINKATIGYNPIANDAVSSFWHAYWQFSGFNAPELSMKRPGGKPAGSTWIYFAPPNLPRETWLVHKLADGYVELTIGGAAGRIGEMQTKLQALLESRMIIERAGMSAAIRIPVPTINAGRLFTEQHEAVALGLAEA